MQRLVPVVLGTLLAGGLHAEDARKAAFRESARRLAADLARDLAEDEPASSSLIELVGKMLRRARYEAPAVKHRGMVFLKDRRVKRRQESVDLKRTEEGYRLTYMVGWGDCPSSCVHKHFWEFDFDDEGELLRLVERGKPMAHRKRWLARKRGVRTTVPAGKRKPLSPKATRRLAEELALDVAQAPAPGPLVDTVASMLRHAWREVPMVQRLGTDGTGALRRDRQSSLVTLTKIEEGFTLTYMLGWGDCPSGCPNKHFWDFTFDASGRFLELVERGKPLSHRKRYRQNLRTGTLFKGMAAEVLYKKGRRSAARSKRTTGAARKASKAMWKKLFR